MIFLKGDIYCLMTGGRSSRATMAVAVLKWNKERLNHTKMKLGSPWWSAWYIYNVVSSSHTVVINPQVCVHCVHVCDERMTSVHPWQSKIVKPCSSQSILNVWFHLINTHTVCHTTPKAKQTKQTFLHQCYFSTVVFIILSRYQQSVSCDSSEATTISVCFVWLLCLQ